MKIRYPLNYVPAYHLSANSYIHDNLKDLNDVKKELELNKIKVLDVGSGLGYLLFESSAHIKGFMGTGLDVDKKRIKFIRKVANVNKVKNLNFVVGNGYDLPFSDRSFHVVICNHVIEHVKYPELVLREIHRTLVTQGVSFIGTPSKKTNPIPRLSNILKIDVVPKNHVVEGFVLEELEDLLKPIGFEIIEKEYKFNLFGKFLHDLTGIVGETRRISTDDVCEIGPFYADNFIPNFLFSLKIFIAKFMSFFYRFDFFFKGLGGDVLEIKAEKL